MNINFVEWNNCLSEVTNNSNLKLVIKDGREILVVNPAIPCENSMHVSAMKISEILQLSKIFSCEPDISLTEKEKMINSVKKILKTEEVSFSDNTHFIKLKNSIVKCWNETTEKKYRPICEKYQAWKNSDQSKIWKQNTIEVQLFNFVLKSSLTKDAELFDEDFGGLNPTDSAFENMKSSLDFLKFLKNNPGFLELTKQDEIELENLCNHRKNYTDYRLKIENNDPILIESLRENIDLLDHPKSDRINYNRDGSRSFAIPGGCDGHTVSYEFLLKDGKYYFIINNRGAGSDDERFHGRINFYIDGKTFSKTSVFIEVKNKEDLKNIEFLNNLLQPKITENHVYIKRQMPWVYDKIFYHFITSGKGKILNSKHEDLLKRFYYALERIHPLVDEKPLIKICKELIEQDECFQSWQLYSTCVESNVSAPERRICSSNLYWNIKHIKGVVLIEKLRKIISFNDPRMDLIHLAEKEIQKLKKYKIHPLLYKENIQAPKLEAQIIKIQNFIKSSKREVKNKINIILEIIKNIKNEEIKNELNSLIERSKKNPAVFSNQFYAVLERLSYDDSNRMAIAKLLLNEDGAYSLCKSAENYMENPVKARKLYLKAFSCLDRIECEQSKINLLHMIIEGFLDLKLSNEAYYAIQSIYDPSLRAKIIIDNFHVLLEDDEIATKIIEETIVLEKEEMEKLKVELKQNKDAFWTSKLFFALLTNISCLETILEYDYYFNPKVSYQFPEESIRIFNLITYNWDLDRKNKVLEAISSGFFAKGKEKVGAEILAFLKNN